VRPPLATPTAAPLLCARTCHPLHWVMRVAVHAPALLGISTMRALAAQVRDYRHLLDPVGMPTIDNIAGPAVAEVDACVNYPCATGGVCSDLPPPASDDPAGRVCTCSAGYIYMDDVSGCVAEGKQSSRHSVAVHSFAGQEPPRLPVSCQLLTANTAEFDACQAYPCPNRADAEPNCQDLPFGPADVGPSGRYCWCPLGFFYDNSQGCVDDGGCALQTVPQSRSLFAHRVLPGVLLLDSY
jgi:hypothetical protein